MEALSGDVENLSVKESDDDDEIVGAPSDDDDDYTVAHQQPPRKRPKLNVVVTTALNAFKGNPVNTCDTSLQDYSLETIERGGKKNPLSVLSMFDPITHKPMKFKMGAKSIRTYKHNITSGTKGMVKGAQLIEEGTLLQKKALSDLMRYGCVMAIVRFENEQAEEKAYNSTQAVITNEQTKQAKLNILQEQFDRCKAEIESGMTTPTVDVQFQDLLAATRTEMGEPEDPPPPPPPPPQMPPPPQDRPLGGRQLGSSFRSNNMGDGPSERDTTGIQVHVKLEKEFANKSPANIQELFDVNGVKSLLECENTFRLVGGSMHSNYDGWEVDHNQTTGYNGALYWFFGPVLRCDADDFANVLCARANHIFNVEFSPYIDQLGRLGVSAITRPVPAQPSKNYKKNAKKRAQKKAKALAVPSVPPAYDESVDPPAYNSTCPQRD